LILIQTRIKIIRFANAKVEPGCVTTAANRTIESIDDRRPVILDEAGAADWMNLREPDPISLKRLLVPAPADPLVVWPASPLVNSVKNEGPELLEDLSLFGKRGCPSRPALPNCWQCGNPDNFGSAT